MQKQWRVTASVLAALLIGATGGCALPGSIQGNALRGDSLTDKAMAVAFVQIIIRRGSSIKLTK